MRAGGLSCALALVCGLFGPGAARASGVEHVIDDADVETAGLCHLESYATRNRAGQGLVVSAPACTRKAWPNLEIGGFVSDGWSAGRNATQIGLSPKWKLREMRDGPGIALKGNLSYGITSGRIETAALLAPVSMPVSKQFQLNLNLGWQYLRGNGGNVFAGAQAEFMLTPRLELMGEVFGRPDTKAGAQAGVRWTVARGRIDLDLAYGRYVDGVTPNAVTLGLAIRFGKSG